MKDIVRYTSQTPVKEIIDEFRYSLYSKHSDRTFNLLDEEVPWIERAMKTFVEQIGLVQSRSVTWKAVYVNASTPYIGFENVKDGSFTRYYDMEEIDRRYIDSAIDEWVKN